MCSTRLEAPAARPAARIRSIAGLIACWLLSVDHCTCAVHAEAAADKAIRATDLGALPPAAARGPGRHRLGTELLLATHLNTRDFGLHPALLRDGTLHLRRGSLQSFGVLQNSLPTSAVNPDANDEVRFESTNEWIALGGIAELQVQFDKEQQSLQLTLPFSHVNWSSTQIHITAASTQPALSTSGLSLNYDLHGAASDSAWSLGVTTEWRAFRADQVLSNTMFSQCTRAVGNPGINTSPDEFKQLRLDTTFSQSFAQRMLTLRIGDTLTGMQPWSRATRIGGIQVARNFSLQPYRVTSPIPALMGTSALPSDIALYINGIQQYQGTVNAGPFTLNAPIGITGAGQAQIVLTDAFGRNTTLDYPLYGSTQLLARGLSDWSAELGWIRKNYGHKSFDYGRNPLLSGSWSYGLNDQLTLQAHGEITSRLVNLGGGGAWRIGSLGIFSAASAVSQHGGQTGALMQLGHSWSNPSFFTSLQFSRASKSYRDAAGVLDLIRNKASGRALLGYNHAQWGSASLGMLFLQNFGQQAERYITASWSRQVSQRGTVHVSVHHNLNQRRQSSVQLMLSWFLGDNISTGTHLSHQSGRNLVSAYVNNPRANQGGWGWSAATQRSSLGMSSQWRSDYLADKFDAHAALINNDQHHASATSASLGATGSLVYMGGHLLASRRIFDGFALINTHGIADVPVKRENNLVGKTDADGVLLVTQLSAYRNNKISIDPLALPAQIQVPYPEVNVVPTDRAGTLVHFKLQRIRSASLLLVDRNGTPLPLGSRASVRDANLPRSATRQAPAQSIVGHDGLAYFKNLPHLSRIAVTQPDGSRCEVPQPMPWPASSVSTDIPMLGPLTCTPL